VGCGAGRVMLQLRQRRFEVVGIDNSPGAIRACKLRGAGPAHLMPIQAVGPALGTFDTILMLGGNLRLLGTPDRAKRLLRRLHRMTTDSGRIIGASRDRTKTGGSRHRRVRATEPEARSVVGTESHPDSLPEVRHSPGSTSSESRRASSLISSMGLVGRSAEPSSRVMICTSP